MTFSTALPTPAAADAQRPYVAPALVVHGDVQTLTLGKHGAFVGLDSGSLAPNAGPIVPSGQ